MNAIDYLAAVIKPYWTWIVQGGGWVAAVYAWFRKRQAERHLRDIQRRSEAPYLVAGPCMARSIEQPVRFLAPPNLAEGLASFSESLGSHGIEMLLEFFNQGQRVRGVSIVQPSNISFVKVGEVIVEGRSPGYIRYVYEHARKGHAERFSLRFETLGGIKQVHTYETIHGVGGLRRVDPE